MKKSSIFILTLSIILTLFVAVACSNETAVVEDQLAYVSFGKSGSRAFTTGLSNAPGKENLFWTYTAIKIDGKLNTGAGTDSISGPGIDGKQVGPFSVGTWQFILRGYAENTHATLVYEGTSDIVTLTAGTNNAIDVNVAYQPKGGNGKLKLDNVYFDYKGSNVITKLKLDLRNVDSSAEPNTYPFEVTSTPASSGTQTKFSLNEENLIAGVYEATFSFYIGEEDGDGETLAYTPFIQNIVVLNNRTTTVSGCITEDQAVNQTFNVTTEDYGYVESDGKYYVYVSDEKALQNALNAAGGNAEAVVVLTCDIPTESIEVEALSSRSISVSLVNNVIIDLNGYSITKKDSSKASELIKMNAPERTLTIKNSKSSGSIDAKNLVGAKVERGTLIIESGKLSGSVAVKVESGANVEISGGHLNATGIAIQNGGNLKVKGGTISGTTAIQVVDSNAKTSVESGKLDANTPVSKDVNVEGNIEVSITDDVEIKEGASISEDITPKKYTGTGSESDPYCVGSQEAIKEVLKAISTNQNTNYFKVIKSFNISEVVTFPNTITIYLDLNGKTITEEGIEARKIVNKGTLTIFDSATDGEIKNESVGEPGQDGSYGLIDNFGTLTIENGNFTDVAHGNGSSFRNRSGATLVINGGTFTNTADDSQKQQSGFNGAANAFVYSDGESVSIFGGKFTMTNAMYTPAIKIMAGTGTINGATISTYKSGGIEVGGEVSISNTNISVSETNSYYANAIAVSNDGVVTVNSGKFTGYSYGTYIYSSGGIINIIDGTFEAGTAVLKADNDVYEPYKSEINVSGGNFTGIYSIANNAKLSISGGKFSSDPSSYVADGYGCRITSDGKYEIVSSREAGYKIGAALPAGPIVSGDTWTVNPANAQYTLDGAYGSINGKTIHFSTGEYSAKLILGRPTKYAGSNTEYRHTNHDNTALSYEDFIDYKNQSGWTQSCYYNRTISNVKFTSDEGVKLPGFVTDAGAHVYGPGSYDYVRDTGIILTDGSCYFTKCKLSNFTFEGLKFEGNTNIATSASETVIDGFVFRNCTFTTNGTESSKGQALRYYNENNNGNVRNLTVDTCTFTNCYQGVYTQHINGVKVINSIFNTTGHNAIAIQSGTHGAVNHKNVLITGNTFTNIGDRIIRFGDVGADTQITIQNNEATDSGDDGGQVIKAQSLAEGVTYNISGNNWGEGKTVANDKFKDSNSSGS